MTFTPYQRLVIAILAFLQFTIVLDFLILSPLGAILIQELRITPAQFGWVVSSYAFSAGISGLLTAGFADRFDRKKLLLFFYGGFIAGTVLCGLAPSYHLLLVARIVTGLFGGVIGSISLAIAADLFPLEVRGRVMGLVQTAFAASQVLGLPLGLWLCNAWGWHAPFLMIASVGAAVGVVIVAGLRPLTGHLQAADATRAHPFQHLVRTASRPDHLRTFAVTVLLATGGFMLMPFGSTFTVNNMGIGVAHLPTIYLVTGICSIAAGPLLGRLADRVGKYAVFSAGSLLGIVMVLLLCTRGPSPLWVAIALNVPLFVSITARMIASQALISAVPGPGERGAFMAINSAIQQFSGGLAAAIAGLIVVQGADGRLERYDVLGVVVALAMLATVVLMRGIHVLIRDRRAATAPAGARG